MSSYTVILQSRDVTRNGGVKDRAFNRILASLEFFERYFTFSVPEHTSTKTKIILKANERYFGVIESFPRPTGGSILSITVGVEPNVPNLAELIGHRIQSYLGYPERPSLAAETSLPGSPTALAPVVPALPLHRLQPQSTPDHFTSLAPQITIPSFQLSNEMLNFPNNQPLNLPPRRLSFGGRKRKATRKGKSKQHTRRQRKTRNHKLPK